MTGAFDEVGLGGTCLRVRERQEEVGYYALSIDFENADGGDKSRINVV